MWTGRTDAADPVGGSIHGRRRFAVYYPGQPAISVCSIRAPALFDALINDIDTELRVLH